ncbi:hypothetical protein, partial [Lacticaseibacillus sp. 53-4]|uniref:hypothetical protein n=2 Tax=unclassified Lacticaseibacillus TaxID=2759744 RepID=UPI001944AA10
HYTHSISNFFGRRADKGQCNVLFVCSDIKMVYKKEFRGKMPFNSKYRSATFHSWHQLQLKRLRRMMSQASNKLRLLLLVL